MIIWPTIHVYTYWSVHSNLLSICGSSTFSHFFPPSSQKLMLLLWVNKEFSLEQHGPGLIVIHSTISCFLRCFSKRRYLLWTPFWISPPPSQKWNLQSSQTAWLKGKGKYYQSQGIPSWTLSSGFQEGVWSPAETLDFSIGIHPLSNLFLSIPAGCFESISLGCYNLLFSCHPKVQHMPQIFWWTFFWHFRHCLYFCPKWEQMYRMILQGELLVSLFYLILGGCSGHS